MLSFILSLITSFSLFATGDSIGTVQIPYTPAHAAEYSFEYLAENWQTEYANTQMFCFAESMYWDEVSSSALPKYQLLVAPFEIPVFPGWMGDTIQINALYDERIKVETNWEDFENYVMEGANNDVWIDEPKFTIDVSAYNQTTAAGRLKAITMAKLAVISLHFNLAERGWSLFRLNLEIKGLPEDQSEFEKKGFTKAYAQTAWPYSGPSALAQMYYEELIAESFCPKTLAEAKTFAQ